MSLDRPQVSCLFRRPIRAAAMTACAVIAIVGASGAAAAETKDDTRVLRFVAADVPPTIVDIGAPGRSVGDHTIFDGAVLDARGQREVGRYYGMQTTVAFGDKHIVQSMITYDLRRGDTLTFGGIGEYPTDGAGLVVGQRFTRPVLGGTGKYAGARGTVSTIRREDGSYEQKFRIET